ncbi:MAG: bifunctional folylpolyglutamate synthase/dihydrofolate synthase [Acidobacteria bacterium]|nr:bifunctional folylpolyglutamate synthase/dihydrofolate synthase [Acidobacteriota bacterium]
MNYPESVRFLYALGNEIKTAKFGLERIRTLLEALGHPERACRFVHVAGTNGKGSTSAMIEAALRAAGERTGLYTSPHLAEPTERVRIGGREVTAERFAEAFERVHEAAERLLEDGAIDLHPTYFETVTAMAFLLFRDEACGRVVLEVGLGGRLDATNVVTPELAVITPVDFDHEQFLGNTIEAIAAEKAGILKPGVPVVMARQRPEAARIIEERARELGCRLARAADASVTDVEVDARGSRFRLNGREARCALAGEHQVDNAVAAALALEQLGAPLDGMAEARWPGRLEHVGERPEIILDGAHNPAGARALAAYIRRFYANRRVWLVYGSMRDKAVEEITGTLFPLASRIIVTAPHFARALRPDAVEEVWRGGNVETAADLAGAIEIVRREALAEDAVFITGSLFVVGEARALLVQ